jgi:glycerate kinase
VEIIGLTDTDNYVCGKEGQIRLFGSQKGLSKVDLEFMEGFYEHFCNLILNEKNVDVRLMKRTSGSGGVGAALCGLLQARLSSTIDYLNSISPFVEQIMDADIIFTGEGTLDKLTKYGKVPYYVASRTHGHCIVIVGNYTAEGKEDLEALNTKGISICCMPQTGTDLSNEEKIRLTTRYALRLISLHL